ncbi:MAG: arginine--tRNA ligase [Promethearchaeota archaeon]
MDQFSELIVKLLAKTIQNSLGLTLNASDILDTLETPPNPELGDRSSNICFKLAKHTKKAPSVIVGDLLTLLREEIKKINQIQRIEAKTGYLNFFLDDSIMAKTIINQVLKKGKAWGSASSPKKKKILVEHTSVNPTKPLHMGHLRNAVLGDTVARIFATRGWQVEVQNLINDSGKQGATMLWAFQKGIDTEISRPEDMKYDVWCGLVYSEAEKRLAENPELSKEVEELMKKIHHDDELLSKLRYLADVCLKSNLETLWNVNITYDLLVWESDISRSELWKETLTILEKSEYFIYETEGSNAGCFVAKLGYLPDFRGDKNPDKVLIRSNKVPTYNAHDIAFQMWKFGLSKANLQYKLYGNQTIEANPLKVRKLWTTVDTEGEDRSSEFGHADHVCNVIGYEQNYLQKILKLSLKLLGETEKSENSVHLSYKHVTLPHESLSGRTGNWYATRSWVDAVIEDSITEALKVVAEKRKDLSIESMKEIAEKIGIGAIRYWLLKFSPETTIKYVKEEATSLKGDTAPFIVYSLTRANKILVNAKDIPKEEVIPEYSQLNTLEEQELLKKITEYPSILQQVEESLRPNLLTSYIFNLATLFNKFYEACPVLSAETSQLRTSRLDVVKVFQITLNNALNVLGIPVPKEM